MSKIQVFEYNGQNISFDFGDGNRMINATEMAKGFGKLTAGFLRMKQTQDFIAILKKRYANSHNENILRVIQGGDAKLQGTWMHEKLALKFAAWLSPEFEVWVYDRIHELLQKGYTTLRPQKTRSISFIYFFKALHLDRIKIGMSKNVHQRLGTVQSLSPVELELIKIIRTNDTYPSDVAIHALFPHLRLHNEWFTLAPELQAFLDELDNVPISEAAAHYELQIVRLRKELEAERQKVFRKNQLIADLTRQLGKVQQEHHELLTQWQEQKEAPAYQLPPSAAMPQDSNLSAIHQTMYLLKDKRYHQVHCKDIAYFKSMPGGASCVLSNGESYHSELNLKDSFKQLPPHLFIQVHKSYVINLRHLTAIDIEGRRLTLCHSIDLFISIKRMKALVERLQFLKKKDNR
ncbi:MAG: KilA-N domain-containing protein [Chitinophagales bacterium]